MPNNAQLELNALAYLTNVRCPELLVRIEPEMFGNVDLRNIFSLVKRYYTEKGTWAGWDVISGIVSKAAKSAERADYLVKLILKIRDREIEGLTEADLLNELSDFKNLRTVMDVSEELIQAVEQKDAGKVVALYKQGYERICVGTSVEEESDLGMLSGEDTKFVFRTTGIAEIDKRSGFAEGGLILYAGESGSGKSTLAHCTGIHNYKNYPGSVAYWTYEQGKKEITARIWSRESQLDLGKLISGELSEAERLVYRKAKAQFLMKDTGDIEKFLMDGEKLSEQEFMRNLYEKYETIENKFLIFDDCLDFDALLLKMELLYSVKGVRVFIIDYITLVPRGRMYRELAQWEYNLYKTQALKTFARKHGDVLVITPVQYDAKDDKIKMASNMLNDADVCISMHQTPEDKKVDIVGCEFKKYRNFTGDPLKNFRLFQEFNKAGFMDCTDF